MKWEYTISFLTSFKHRNGELEKHLNEMGQAGWELIAVDNGMIYFKKTLELTEADTTEVFEVGSGRRLGVVRR